MKMPYRGWRLSLGEAFIFWTPRIKGEIQSTIYNRELVSKFLEMKKCKI